MYGVYDIVNKILAFADKNDDPITNLKLQKLLYYEQGFHLAYFGTPLFNEDLEAWIYGPVVPSVYEHFSKYGRGAITDISSNIIKLTKKDEEQLFYNVLRVYNKFSASALVEMTHNESPWKTTNVGTGSIIEKAKLIKFFKTRLK